MACYNSFCGEEELYFSELSFVYYFLRMAISYSTALYQVQNLCKIYCST